MRVMQGFKVDNFAKENPGAVFPWVRSLGRDECGEIRARLAQRLGIGASSEARSLLKRLEQVAEEVSPVLLNGEDIDLQETLSKVKIAPLELVYINWYRFDDIDQMKVKDLDRFLSYIWYPSSDDIEVFDELFEWILLLRHDGLIRIARFSTDNR